MPGDLDDLLQQAIDLMRRDLRNISIEGTKGKLSAASSRDLVNYVKVLNDAQDRQEDNEAQVLAAAKKLIAEAKADES